MLYYIILCYIILNYIILYNIILYYVILYCIMLYYIILCYVILCYFILYYIMLYYIILCYVILCYIMLYYIISYIICPVFSVGIFSKTLLLCSTAQDRSKAAIASPKPITSPGVMALHLATAAGHAPQWLWIKFQAQKTADVGHMWWFPLLCFVGYFNFDPCPAGHQC